MTQQRRIFISPHARDQLYARCDERRDDRTVKAEIVTALAEGRQAIRRPRWLGPGPKARGSAFFCWPPEQDRVYVVEQSAEGLALITVLIESFEYAFGIGRAGAGV